MKDMTDALIVGLDVPDMRSAKKLIDDLADTVTWIKIEEPFISAGTARTLIAHARAAKMRVMLDLKLHRIPSAMRSAVRAVASRCDMFTVHVSSGPDALRAAAEEKGKAKMLAVTVLTSHTTKSMAQSGLLPFHDHAGNLRMGDLIFRQDAIPPMVIAMMRAARANGADGLVCSAQELGYVQHHELEHDLLERLSRVVPGIRPDWYSDGKDDQARTMTPSQALKAGAHMLVIGRPIISNKDPKGAAKRIIDEMSECVLTPQEFFAKKGEPDAK